MQTILGSGGAIGQDLARELKKYTDRIRLVSRNPEKVNSDDELFSADLNIGSQVEEAVSGSEIVYLTAGFEYKIKVWEETWPRVMRNVIEACRKHGAKLVFFDNMYMYDPDYLDPMTEETPVNPSSKKGEVRARIQKMVLDAVKKKEIQALIARSADFYGPKNSLLAEMVYKNLKKGKKAMWIASVNKVHNFTFTPDAAKATALLGNTPQAYGEVWHLPTTGKRLTMKDWIDHIAGDLDVKSRYTVVPAWMLTILGIVNPVMREFREMSYQYDRNYFFDSGKFEGKFDLRPTSPAEGIRQLREMY